MQSYHTNSENTRSRLVIRLSSLGDIILSTSALETRLTAEGVDWVVANEFSSILEGHPRIRRVWRFDRTTGIKGWWTLWRQIWDARYDEVYDLHCSLRSKIARFFFWVWSIREGRSGPRWIVLGKERWRLYGYFIFKGIWPKRLRPLRVVERFAKCLGGCGDERPNLRHLLKTTKAERSREFFLDSVVQPFICVMPGAQWPGKRWSVDHYFLWLEQSKIFPVVLGSPRDEESFKLVELLKKAKRDHLSGVGVLSLPQVAQVLAKSIGYLGNDTGLAHLAESVGVRSWVIFGPTASDMGFGPWRHDSVSFEAKLWCRPCGKDGRYCFRINHKYRCLSDVTPEKIQMNS